MLKIQHQIQQFFGSTQFQIRTDQPKNGHQNSMFFMFDVFIFFHICGKNAGFSSKKNLRSFQKKNTEIRMILVLDFIKLS